MLKPFRATATGKIEDGAAHCALISWAGEMIKPLILFRLSEIIVEARQAKPPNQSSFGTFTFDMINSVQLGSASTIN